MEVCEKIFFASELIYLLILFFISRRFARSNPLNTRSMLITWIQENFSCRINTASRLLNIGMRFPNKAVLPAPNMLIEIFQIKKQITEAPTPRYKIEIVNPIFQCIADVLLISHKKNGNNKIVPRKKLANRKFTGEIEEGFFLTKIL